MTIVYQAIFEDLEKRVFVEYAPVPGVPGAIEITGVHVEPRLLDTIYQEREASRRRHKRQPVQRQLWNDPRDEI